jgi:hypothetical protein
VFDKLRIKCQNLFSESSAKRPARAAAMIHGNEKPAGRPRRGAGKKRDLQIRPFPPTSAFDYLALIY